ncbi:isochorismate synthase [Streptomyces sp. PRB2-1]|uniref:isochorismate synthase n=1 Tax=Actinacidiphila epipremni TaxID=2053013 RepID=A0ABX0ZYW7_9ACTN|nr:isochorismate synthase [Actinacidiphila epipremni]
MPVSTLTRPRPVHRPAELLAAYLTGSFYFSSPYGTLLADGVRTRVHGSPRRRAAAAARALDEAAAGGVPDPVVVGALGFRPDAEASLLVPAVVRRAAAPSAAAAHPPGGQAPTGWTVRLQPEPDGYVGAVGRALDLIGQGALRKVVLARCLKLTAADPVAVTSLLAGLVRANPAAYAFAADVTAPGDRAPRTLVGASPELLVARNGVTVTANPLAGSAPRAGEASVDRARVAALRDSAKDLGEHAHTAGHVADVLGRFCTDLDVPERPEVIGTPTMWHLSTRISGRLRDPADPDCSALGLAEALHPTPAVGGVPADRALTAIAALEPQDRGYYAGMVGWTDRHGDGEWALSIRSAEVCDRTVRLFAGAGIVADSDPRAELAETAAKFRTLLGALGFEDPV